MTQSISVIQRVALSALVLATAALVTACFDGGDDDGALPVAKEEAPASAGDSTAAFVAFTQSLSPSETAEPLELNLVAVAPISESDDPVVLN